MLRWILTIVIAWFCLLVDAYGQEYLYKHYTVEDGLPSNTIYTVYRDSKGFLWITTDKGVARYNGIRFEKFTTFNGLSDNEVFGCREDYEGRLWFVTYNGELCYYKDDTFHNPKNTPFLRRPSKQPHAKLISLQNDGTLVIPFYNGGYFCCVEGNRNYVIDLTTLGWGPNVSFHAGKTGPSRFSILRDEAMYTVDAGPPSRVIDAQIRKKPWRYVDQFGCQGQEYLFGDTGIFTIDEKLIYPFRKDFQKRNTVHQAYKNQKYWFFATGNGLYVDGEEGKRELTNMLPGKDVSCITQGKNGEYWVSTLGDGIYLFPESFVATRVSANAYNGKVIYAKEEKGRLFFCGEKRDLNVFENGVARQIIKLEKPHARYDNVICYIDSGLNFYHLSTSRIVKVGDITGERMSVTQYPCDLLSVNVFKKVVKSGDKLYLQSSGNVLEVDTKFPRIGDSVRFRELGEYGTKPFCIAKNADEEVWFSTIDKVFKVVDGHAIQQKQFGDISFKQFDFIGDHLVGYTHNNQLLVCRYKERKPLIDTVFQDCVWENIYKLDDKHLLISTNGPYYTLTLNESPNGKPKILAIESKYLPLLTDKICIGKDNCYFFEGGSVVSVPKSELLKRSATPVVEFTTIRSAKRSCRIGNFVELPYSGSGSIAISFSTLSLDGKDVIYQYSISNDERNKWVNFRGDINLANQAFGRYTVKVKAKTMSSEWSDPVAFTLIIDRPFWAEWWFVGLCVCVTALLIFLVVRRRIQQTLRNREKEHENKVKYIKSEYKALNALMNPHFIFNALNNVQSLVNNDDKLNAIEYLAIFADLIRQNMHNISNEVIPLEKELELVENYLLLEKLRFEDQLSYTINVSDGVYIADITVPPLLIQPLVENSIKHGILPLKSRGIKGILQVNIYEQNETLYIEVRDNGIGIAKAKERKSLHKSFGLDNLKLRLEQLSIIQGKEISFSLSDEMDDNEVRWTVAMIAVPLESPEPAPRVARKMAKP